MTAPLVCALEEMAARIKPAATELKGVWLNRNTPIEEADCPCAIVFAMREAATEIDSGPSVFRVEAEIRVEIVHAPGAALEVGEDVGDRELLELSDKVRAALTRDQRLGQTVERLIWTGSEFALLDRGGEVLFLSHALTFSIHYLVETPAAGETELAPFRSIGIETDGAPEPDGTTDKRDNVILDQ